ncbi:MAG TPA: hypothetical protein DHV36_08190 [Desulfobacteraceae bacterium]|nr:hypothetical protein [Desulfobacteraceae bacterium]|tara:strand:+ start:206 stop:418 length:213 start_codon:yes stop_codon:yes gene_type:complete
MTYNRLIIRAELLYDGLGCAEKKTTAIAGAKIEAVSKSCATPDYKEIVTPVVIDPHSQIGMERQAEVGPW